MSFVGRGDWAKSKGNFRGGEDYNCLILQVFLAALPLPPIYLRQIEILSPPGG